MDLGRTHSRAEKKMDHPRCVASSGGGDTPPRNPSGKILKRVLREECPGPRRSERV